MILLITLLWCLGFVVTSTLVFVVNNGKEDIWIPVILAFIWPLIGAYLLYLMIRYLIKD